MMQMGEQPQYDPAAIEALKLALERMGTQVGGLTQQAAYWELKYNEREQTYQAIMELLKRNDVDLEALVASEANEVAPGGPELEPTVLVPEEDGDDAPAPS